MTNIPNAASAVKSYCRNPRFRSKLSAPVTNPRDAFCTRGCHGSFYLKRCRVCEEPIEQGGGRPRLICRKSKCRNAWEGDFPGGRYHPTSSRENSSKTPDFIDSKPDRACPPINVVGGYRWPNAPRLNRELLAAVLRLEIGDGRPGRNAGPAPPSTAA
jgi:hypothetical protein